MGRRHRSITSIGFQCSKSRGRRTMDAFVNKSSLSQHLANSNRMGEVQNSHQGSRRGPALCTATGWKAPKPPGYVKPPPSMLQRASRGLKEEILYPPIPFEGQPLPPRKAAQQQPAPLAAATGARPKTFR
jgi:hypothetical protein